MIADNIKVFAKDRPSLIGLDIRIKSDTGPIIENKRSGDPTFSVHMAQGLLLGFLLNL